MSPRPRGCQIHYLVRVHILVHKWHLPAVSSCGSSVEPFTRALFPLVRTWPLFQISSQWGLSFNLNFEGPNIQTIALNYDGFYNSFKIVDFPIFFFFLLFLLFCTSYQITSSQIQTHSLLSRFWKWKRPLKCFSFVSWCEVRLYQ